MVSINPKNIQKKLFEDYIINCNTIDELQTVLDQKKMVRAGFCSMDLDGEFCAKVIEKEYSAFVRGKKPNIENLEFTKCIVCEKPAKETIYIAKSY